MVDCILEFNKLFGPTFTGYTNWNSYIEDTSKFAVKEGGLSLLG